MRISIRFLEEVATLTSKEGDIDLSIFLLLKAWSSFKLLKRKERACVVLLSYFCLEYLEKLQPLLGKYSVFKKHLLNTYFD